MSETKEMLEATVKSLQEKIVSLQHDLREKEKDLEDVNKPVISSDTMDIVNDAVNAALEDYQFDCGMFEYEFNLSYENRIEIESLNFTGHYELNERIAKEIFALFKEVEDDNS